MKVEHFSFSHYYLSLFEAFAQGRMKLSSLNIDCNPGPASYPDVSLDVRAKEGGKETMGETSGRSVVTRMDTPKSGIRSETGTE